MEHFLLKSCQNCESTKVTERKKGMKELSEHLSKAEAVEVLNRNTLSDRVNWNALFAAAHLALVTESEHWQADEVKARGSATSATTRENTKAQYSSTVSLIVKKANAFKPQIKFTHLSSACFRIFSDNYLLKNFGFLYFGFLRDDILPVRIYRNELSYDQWDELFDHVMKFLTGKNKNMKNWAIHSAVDLMELVVYHGCRQSQLGLLVKNKLLPFLWKEFDNLLHESAAVEDPLLSLLYNVCTSVAKESRTGVCYLGEVALNSVMKMYDDKCEVNSTRNQLVLKFLMLQVTCHHPHGVKPGNEAAYACDWSLWNRHLQAMYRLVLGVIQRKDKLTGCIIFDPLFLNLCVELCNQLFDLESCYDISLSVNELTMGSAPKRRKWTIGIEAIIEELQLGKKDASSGRWISLLSGILQKYSSLIKNCELHLLLEILIEMMCNCRNSQIMACICNCCEQLLAVMTARKLNTDLWLKVWEATLRSVGLNQSECHPLLRALMMKRVALTTGLESLLRMFMSQMIQLSNESLQTLVTLLSFYNLPEISTPVGENHVVAPWELPISSARVVLLDWLFMSLPSISVDIEVLANVLVRLVVKHTPEAELCKPLQSRKLRETSLEDDYCLSAFEDRLLVPPDLILNHSSTGSRIADRIICSNIIDSVTQSKLQACLRTIELDLKQRLDDIQEAMSLQTVKAPSQSAKLKLELTSDVVKYACLLANILSFMVKYGAVENSCLDNSRITTSLTDIMEFLTLLLPEALKPAQSSSIKGLVADVPSVCQVLQSLRLLYGSTLVPCVGLHLRTITPPGVVVPLTELFSEFSNEGEDEFWDLASSNDASSKTLEDSLISHSIDVESLTDVDRIHVLCLDILTQYGCPNQGTELGSKQKTVINRILKTLADGELYDMTLPLTFHMVYRSLSTILSFIHLDQEKNVNPTIKLLQEVCKKWNKDAEASSYIMLLIKDVFKHVASNKITWENKCSTLLFTPFSNKKFGPNFTVQLLSCYETLLMADKNSLWARWNNASSFRQIVETDKIPSEALRKFEDENGLVAIVEEVITLLLSPFHEVRLAAVSYVASVLNGQHGSPLWQQTMFQRLSVILYDLFTIKEEKMSHEEKIDESANRTATVLHVISVIIATSSKYYKQALLLFFRLLKEKNLSIGLVKKVFGMLASPMKLQNIQTFLEKSLPCLLDEWLQWGYQLKEFPYSLLNVSSFSEFCISYKEIVLPVVFRNKDLDILFKSFCQAVQSSPLEVLKASFPAIYAHYLPALANGSSKTESFQSARKQFKLFDTLIGSHTIKQLVPAKISDILVEVTRLVWDVTQHKNLLELNSVLNQTSDPFISQEEYLTTLKYLEEQVGTNLELLVYLGRYKPIVLQKVFLQLREDMFAPVTFDQRILSLHKYCAFSHAVAVHIEERKLPNMEYFLLSDMTHTLLYLIIENQSNPSMRDVCVGSCCYLKVVYEHLLPACAATISSFLPLVVGSLVPLALNCDILGEKSLNLLKLLIITHHTHLGHAIGQLPPFPNAPGFEEMGSIHSRLKYGTKIFTLQDEIKHFLNFEKCTTSFVDCNSIFYGLQFLQQQLCERKAELSMLYQGLEVIRGFSQDCKESVVHQLICTLISLLSSENVKVQLEASRCLGELGPADLTTLVLRPAEGCISKVQGYTVPLDCVMALAARTLSDILLDRDVHVVKVASCALLSLMTCGGADSLYSDGNLIGGMLLERRVSPFIVKGTTKTMPSVTSDVTRIINMLCKDDIWCPGEDVQHNDWITRLVSELFICLSDDHSYFRDLASVCKVKTSFAEEMLPVLFYLGLSYSSDVCHQLCTRLAQFFENHCNSFNSKQNSQSSNSSSCSANIYMNRISVQCMLNVVNFIRLQKSLVSDEKVSLEVLNYLHIASAAQFCQAYFSSIMYLELWCNCESRIIDFDGGSGVAYVDYIYEVHPEDGEKLQTLLREAYKQIGDDDALYGCGSSIFLNPHTRVNQYEHIGKWDKVLLNYDVKLSRSKDVKGTIGLAHALYRNGLLNLLDKFLVSLPADQSDHLCPAQVECMWRLGQWGKSFPPSPKVEMEEAFEWKQYSALQAIRDGNKSLVNECVSKGRLSVLAGLIHSSLESCNNIYKPLAQLQALQEIEDVVACDDTHKVFDKWKAQSDLPYKHIFLLETILAQRQKMIESLILQGDHLQENFLRKTLTQLSMNTAQLARKAGQTQIAEQWLHSLSLMPHLSLENKHQLRLEEAQLVWCTANGEMDAATNSVARQLLGSLLKDVQTQENGLRKNSNFHAQALILYGKWMAETQSENPQKIIEDYLEEALNILERLSANNSLSEKLEAHQYLAHFADLEYQRITSYIKSESFQNKVQCMEELLKEGNQLQQGDESTDEHRRAARLNLRCSTIDKEEIKHTYEDQNHFITLALRHYLMSLKLGEGESLPVFRIVSLWLENTSHDILNQLVSSFLDDIQTHKFVLLLPQLAARLGDDMKDRFSESLYKLLFRCCLEHPHHTLPLILALANSYEDPDSKGKFKSEPRIVCAKRMLSEVKKDKSVRDILLEMERLASALISLAYLPIPGQANKVCAAGYNIPKGEKIQQINNFNHTMLPIISLPVQSDGKYNNVIGIHSFKSKYFLSGGITRPKKIDCRGTDGIERSLLVKGKDDLRQDAVMQQVFTIMNTLLQACKETKRQRLLIRTYKIVPLSRKSGVLEWCQNTSPLQVVLPAVHSKYYPEDLESAACRKMIERVKSKSNAERLRAYKEVCKKFHPAFRFFFIETFPTPAEWFDHRLAYVHSVATNSMVGFILGLGDRHVSNILIDKDTAELIHIDFGIAFEQGRLLPTPETVPFRLSRDIVDGMGVSGVEGVFRRSCEKTIAVLRRNQEKILTILEVLLYDPLCDWTVTSKKAAKQQRGNISRASISSDSEVGTESLMEKDRTESSKEKNRMAARALSRLQKKLQGTEEGPVSSIEGQVNRLIQQARDPANLSVLFAGWQAYY